MITTKKLQSLMWAVIMYAAQHESRELTLSDLALAGVDIDDMPAVKEEFYRRDWLGESSPAAYMVLAHEPHLFQKIELVEFGTIFEYNGFHMYIPHDGPSERERDGGKLPQVESPYIVYAKVTKKDHQLNPRGVWMRISWGTIVLRRPDLQLRR